MRMVKALLAVAMAFTALVALSGSAAAQSGSINPGGNITSASLGKLTFDGGIAQIQCNVEMRGALRTGVIPKLAGTNIGQVTGVTISNCTGGSVIRVDLDLPWQLTYSSISGTLPNAVTGLLFYVNNASFLLSISLLGTNNCLYRGRIGASIAAIGSNPYTSGLISVLSGDQNMSVTTLNGICPNGTLRGSFNLTPRQTITRL